MRRPAAFLHVMFIALISTSFFWACENPIGKIGTDRESAVSRALIADGGLGEANGLGVHYTPSESRFAIWSPDSSNVVLNLNGTDYPASYDGGFPYSDIYSVTVPGNHHLAEYYFKIGGIAVRDPYGVMAKPDTNVNIVIDLELTDPVGGWVSRPDLQEREDAIIYEIHIRDFTLDSSSGVSAPNRGTFLGMVETGTTYDGYSTGIDHLKELGINTVQILPFYDFSTAHYNWGYDPRNYNVPEEQYASDSADYIARIRELKTMINEFHRNGIRVVMDVVYNHTYENEMFENITDRYYTGTDLSGTGINGNPGNAIDTSEPMVSQMILDSLNFWVEEYNIDGFRFDLMGVFHYDAVRQWGIELNSAHPDRTLLLYGEPWMGGSSDPEMSQKVRLGKMPVLHDAHIGAFNDQFRTAIKGSSDGSDGNFIFNNGNGNNMRMGSRGGILYNLDSDPLPNDWDPMFAYDPEQTITYVTAHDNYTLWDKIAKVGPTGAYARRIDLFAMGIIFTSQGISFMHGGSEMLRSKVYNGDWTYAHNSYNAPDAYNKIYWNLKEENYDIFTYYKDMIALRKNHPGFRMNTWHEIDDHVATTVINDKVIVTEIDADKNGDTWDQILVIYNSGNEYTYSLPQGTWEVVAEETDGSVSRTVSGSVVAAGTAVTVLKKAGSAGWGEAYFRGTPNAWSASPMTKNPGSGLWETSQTFGTDNPRFKITHFADWSESYPTQDYPITQGAGDYAITFDDISKAITVTKTGGSSLTVHFKEFEYAASYILHPWNGLSGDLTMSYEGSFAGSHWWSVNIQNPPANFSFCFTNTNGTWDGGNRLYSSQGGDIYVLPWNNTVYTSRP